MLQSTVSEKKEKFSAAIKKGKDFHYLTIKSEPTRRFNWKNSPKIFNEFFPVSKRQKASAVLNQSRVMALLCCLKSQR